MMSALLAVLRRDLRLALRQGADSLMVVAFFVITVTLFPFGVGPEQAVLERISSGVVWVTALLAAMLSLDRLFQADFEDGSLDLLTLTPTPTMILVAGKMIAHWLTTGLPLIVASPLLALLLHMQGDGYWILLAAMALGTPSLSMIGGVGAALILGARRGGVLLSLLVLPLYIPVLVFGVSAVESTVMGLDGTPQLMILAALLLGGLVVCPWAASAALKQAVA